MTDTYAMEKRIIEIIEDTLTIQIENRNGSTPRFYSVIDKDDVKSVARQVCEAFTEANHV